ncbi:MAG: winged helix-turn-helix domain-containing protein [Cellvibrionaceae bacterium]
MSYKFSNIEIDTQLFILMKDNNAVHVEPLVFDLIIFLIEKAGQVTSQDQIMDAVWKNKIVSPTTISSAIKSARKVLGDDGSQQKFIRTIRGRGFQFIADVEPKNKNTERDRSDHPQKIKKLQYTLIINTFQLLEESTELQSISHSLRDNLSTTLIRIPFLTLKSSISNHNTISGNISFTRQKKEIIANYILSGNIKKTNNIIRVDIKLLQSKDGTHLWAQQYELSNSPNITDKFTHTILLNLEPQLLQAMMNDIESMNCSNSQRNIFEAMTMLSLKGWHENSFQKAATLLRQSIKDEPNNPLALGYLSLILALGQRIGLLGNREATIKEAIKIAERALDLENMNSNVLGLVGCAYADTGETDRALPILQRAIELNPNNGQALAALGAAELILGHLDVAIKYLEKGIMLSPADGKIAVWGTILSLAYLQKNSPEIAIKKAQHASLHDNQNYLPMIALSASFLIIKDINKAENSLKQAYRINSNLTEKQILSLLGKDLGTQVNKLVKP